VYFSTQRNAHLPVGESAALTCSGWRWNVTNVGENAKASLKTEALAARSGVRQEKRLECVFLEKKANTRPFETV